MKRVLVVAGDSGKRQLVRRCLETLDQAVEVVFASDGTEALDRFREGTADLVLTDLSLPRAECLELIGRMHREQPLVPVVLLITRGREQLAIEALREGAASYVPEDAGPEEIAATLEQVLEVAEAQRHRTEVQRFLVGRETRFELPSDVTLIGPLVACVQEGLERTGFGDEGMRTQVGVALMEGVANAMVRGNLEVGSELRGSDRDAYEELIRERVGQEPYASRRVTVVVVEGGNRLSVRIRDEGPGFDPDDIPDPTSAENLLEVSGRGIMLMRTFMDSVEFNERGNEVVLVKHDSASN